MKIQQKMNKFFIHIILFCIVILFTTGCSTTRRLAADETLYTGVKKITFTQERDDFEISGAAESTAKEPLSIAPNNPLYAPYWRTPLPIGLWAYNYLYTPKEKGFKYWLYKRLAKSPVLISDVRPELRTKVVNNILENYGYFGATTDYELLPRKRRPQKARVSYHIHVPAPSFYSKISYLSVNGPMGEIIERIKPESLLREGAQYNLDTLVMERNRITDTLRNHGYYYFRPEYIEYLADTTEQNERIHLKMSLHEGVPAAALKAYRIGDVRVSIQNPTTGQQDSLIYNGLKIIYERPEKVRPKILDDCISLFPGDIFTISAQNTTQSNLTKLGIFKFVNLNVTPLDSLKSRDSLDVAIDVALSLPYEAEFEVNLTSKSNSFLGPGATFSLRNINVFKGGEALSLHLNGSYEWQTGSRKRGEQRSSLLNSYELGITTSLDIPRLIAPKFIHRNAYPAHTSFQLGADLMNRPGYFHMISFNGSVGYNFQSTKNSFHNLTLFKLVYNKLLHTSESFDITMDENPAIALSFRDQFIPSIGYTYTFDKGYGAGQKNRLLWTSSVTSAGNILAGVMELFNVKGTKHLFGSPFSQFIKATSEIRFYHRIGMNNMLASRFMVGAEHAYGNSRVMPYSEQFYIGGANSIRAFTIRSLGPGSYHPPKDKENAYWDQTGTFKLEANVEFRFKMIAGLNGAVFLDAGNIWLLKNDPNRPGGKLTKKDFFNDIALGTGVGLRYDISVLVLRLDMGIGLHLPYQTSKSGYYNIPDFKDGLGFHLAIGYPF